MKHVLFATALFLALCGTLWAAASVSVTKLGPGNYYASAGSATNATNATVETTHDCDFHTVQLSNNATVTGGSGTVYVRMGTDAPYQALSGTFDFSALTPKTFSGQYQSIVVEPSGIQEDANFTVFYRCDR